MGSWVVYASRFRRARATVAIPWERRGDFSRLWGVLQEREDAPKKRGPAWKRVKKRSLGWYDSMIEELAARSWIRLEAPAERIIPAVAKDAIVRLRVDDEEVAAAADAPGIDFRIVRRRDNTGVQLARFIARAVSTPVREMSRAQRRLRARVRKMLRGERPETSSA